MSSMSDLTVMLQPEDDDTAFAAGVQFARALAGAGSAAFMLALGEQEVLVRDAIVQAADPAAQARLACEAFVAGARTEWRRISWPTRPGTAMERSAFAKSDEPSDVIEEAPTAIHDHSPGSGHSIH